ncbi:MAG: DUF1287 domain-containing protein [Alphaproteobacteria bacterium]|nr:DUF1287 domain-containing protein [Alphaproteobacteria bacterium]
MLAFALTATAHAEPKPGDFAQRLATAAKERIGQTLIYDPSYQSIGYPGGDVKSDRGVCTDVVIRSYRALGIDLQKQVHLDMRRSFRAYPRRWGLKRPDTNIDHRRVPNLRRFFIRKGKSLPISLNGDDYKVGDLVTWDLGKPGAGLHPAAKKRPDRLTNSRTPHIGIVSDRRSSDGQRPLIVHNIGGGTELSDVLFRFQITGRYRYLGQRGE